jgi:GDP-4-dehydro-6-deoxy-D-mannose reductase
MRSHRGSPRVRPVARVLITGAGGFAGTHLTARLASHGDEVVPLNEDVRDLDALREAISAARPSAIAHLAGLASVAETWGAERTVWDVNATGTLNLLLAARDAAPKARVLIVSSAEIYGVVPEERQPIGEDEPIVPRSPYGLSKAAAEVVAEYSPLDVTVARPFNHIGPGQDTRFAIPSFCAQIAEIERGSRPPRIEVGNLTARRDFSDVRDVVEAYRLLLEPGGPAGPFNIASGATHVIGDVLDRLLALASVPIAVIVDESRLRPSDVPMLCGDATRVRDALGWAPSRELDATLADTLAYFRALAPSAG